MYITDNQILLNFPMKINDEAVLHPWAYDGAVLDMLSGADNFAFLQNTTHGGTPIAQFYPSTKECTLYGDCSIPIFYNKPPIDILFPNIYNDIYIKTEIDTWLPNIDLSNYHTKTETDDLDNELPTSILDTYSKSEIDTFLTDYYNVGYLNTQFDLKANSSNTYTKSEVDNIINPLDIPSMLSTDNNGSNIIDILNTRNTKTEVDGLISTSCNKTETGNLLNQKTNTPGNSVIQGSLDANVYRCGEIKIISDGDLNALTLTHLTANEPIIDLRTEESFANVYLNVKGFPYIGLSTTNNITMYKDTTIDGNTTTYGDSTGSCNLAYTGDDSYTNSEIDGFLDLNEHNWKHDHKWRFNSYW